MVAKFQDRVAIWVSQTLGYDMLHSRKERNYRLLEESLELVQTFGCTKEEALKLVDYVFDRKVGSPEREVGGVLVCLAALSTSAKIDMMSAGEKELERCWRNIDKIRRKQAAKPRSVATEGSARFERKRDE